MAKMYNLDNLSAEERAIVLARRAYQKQWRDKNKDKVKAATTRYWLKKPIRPPKTQKFNANGKYLLG